MPAFRGRHHPARARAMHGRRIDPGAKPHDQHRPRRRAAARIGEYRRQRAGREMTQRMALRLHGALLTLDPATGKALKIKRIEEILPSPRG